MTAREGKEMQGSYGWISRMLFVSVSHETMWQMLECLNVPSHFVAICKEIYTDSSQKTRCKKGITNDIPIMQGIKQGCPLSSLLFNLVLKEVLPELEKMKEVTDLRMVHV